MAAMGVFISKEGLLIAYYSFLKRSDCIPCTALIFVIVYVQYLRLLHEV